MTDTKQLFSLVLPAFNEAENIANLIRNLAMNFQKNEMSFEIIVVDDGSTDDTGTIIEELKKEVTQLNLVHYSPNKGIGNAVRTGLAHAHGEILGFMVSDGQIRGPEVVKVYNELVEKNLEICKGIRLKRADTAMRAIQSKAYNILFRILFGNVGRDVNSAPKLFRRSLYEKMDLSSHDWFIDPETVIKARRLGCVIVGVPIDEHPREGGTSKIKIRTALQFLKNMLVYRLGYDTKALPMSGFHWMAIVLSLLVGAVYVSHHFFIPRFIEGDGVYYPITLDSDYSDEAKSYGGRANAAYLGDWIVSDINTFENKDTPAWLPILNPLIMGGLGILAGSLKNGIILSDFLFSSLIFLLLYFLMYEITSRQTPSYLFASLFIFSPLLGMFIPPVSNLNIHLLINSLVPFLNNDQALYFSFFEEPKITFFFYTLAFYLVFRALKRGGRATTALAGVSFGLLFYTYLYDWVSFLSALGLLFLFFLFKKNYVYLKQIFLIIVIGFAVSLFYWVQFLQVRALPQYYDIITRHAIEFSHRFRFITVWKSYLRDIALVFALWFVFWKRGALLVVYLAGFLLSYFIMVNMQIVTGFNPQPDHWYRTQFLVVAVSIFMLCVWLYDRYLTDKIQKKYAITLSLLFLAYFFLGNLYSEYVYSKVRAQDFVLDTKTAERYAWLNEHTEKDSVVGTLNFDVAHGILVHTHNKLFVPVGDNNAASDTEIWERLAILSKELNISPKDFSNFIEAPKTIRALFLHRFDTNKSFDRDFRGGSKSALPGEIYRENMRNYIRLVEQSARSATIPYRLDYLWVGNKERAIGANTVKISDSFDEVYSDTEVRIFRVPTKQSF